MKVATIVNQLLKIEDEFNRLEQENLLLRMALKNSGKPNENIILEKLVFLGKQKLFKDLYKTYYSDLTYNEDGASITFEKWFEKVFNNYELPNDLSLNEVKEIVMELFENEYARILKLAQLEYARSQIGKEE